MKKITCISLLCCLIIYIGGYHLVYDVYRSGIKQEMKNYLSHHTDNRYGTYLNLRIDKGLITDPAFSWEDVDEEFRYDGEWYDVVTVQHINDSIRICALKDNRENDLEKQLNSLRIDTDGNNTGPVNLPLAFFSVFDFVLDTPVALPATDLIHYADQREFPLMPQACDITVPPPQC